MEPLTPEKANYIIAHYMQLLNKPEKIALKQHRHSLKLSELPDGEVRTKIYLRNQWLTDEPEILAQLDEGYVQFILNCAGRILKDYPDEVFFNYCAKCGKLARTPQAKQCRFCGYDWHE